ncbi:MAG: TetR/AcrR family transcriptional regulator [Acidimicrobiales bacterium]
MTTSEQRQPLTPERVLRGAVDLADRIGVEALTMRRLADHLGVKPMSIYHHVPSKEEILDGMVDIVFGEIVLPPEDLDWQDAIRTRCVSARSVLNRHPWAPPLMESRTSPGLATLTHHDAVIACLRRGGLSFALTAHAYAVVDSYLYGFTLQEANLPFGGGGEITDLADDLVAAMPDEQFPALVEFVSAVALRPGYSFGASFEYGLDLILDGLARAVDAEGG